MKSSTASGSLKAIDSSSVHRITSGQVVVDLQTAVKELVENSLDAGATSIEIRLKNYGLKSIEVVDNGSGIAEKDFASIGRKHHTSKLNDFHDLMTLTSFGFRGEALSSLCALCEGVAVTTATVEKAPMGTVLDLDKRGEVKSTAKAVRQRGTTVLLTTPFAPLPVRRKELERNIKREFGKALALLNGYALGPCCGLGSDKAVRLSVTNQPDKGAKTTHISLPLPSSGSTPSLRTVRAGATALYGPKALDGIIDLEMEFDVPKITAKIKRRKSKHEEDDDEVEETFKICVKGLISSPATSSRSGSRSSSDRQFFYINGRPCTLNKVQKVINEVYRSFLPSNSTTGQFPFVVVDFNIPGDAVDVNVTPDKRTILVHAETELCERMKETLETLFSPSRSTYDVNDLRKSASIDSTPSIQSPFSLARKFSTGDTAGSKDLQDRDDAGEEEQGLRRISLPPIATIPDKTSNVSQIHRESVNHEESLPPGTKNAPIQNNGEDEDSMDIDVPPAPVSPTLPLSSNQRHRSLASPTKHSPLLPNDSRVVVMSTIGASWNRERSIHPGTPDPEPSAAKQPSLPNASQREANVERADSEPPRKKRKSLHPLSEDEDGEEEEEEKDYSKVQKTQKKARQVKLTDMLKGKTTTTRQELRSQLIGFARSGSKIPHQSSDIEGDSDEEKGEEEENHDGGKEKANPVDGNEDSSSSLSKISRTSLGQDSDGPLFLPDGGDDEEDSMIIGASDDLLVIPSSGNTFETSASSSVSISTRNTSPPPASSSVLNNSGKSSEMVDLTVDDEDDNSLFLASSNSEQVGAAPHAHPEIIRTESSQSSSGDVRLRFDLSKISERWTNLHNRLNEAKTKQADDVDPRHRNSTATLPLSEEAGVSVADAQKSEAALSRVITKQDFKEMVVLGQFNLGFIIVRRQKVREEENATKDGNAEMLDDLFIVDQHAADEKYNFETLQQTTKIQSQRLFKPQYLELTASNELIALENLDILQLNGFELEVDGDAQEDNGDDIQMLNENGDPEDQEHEQGVSHRKLKLIAQPVSKNTVFDMRDLEELIQLMHDQPTGTMVRCSKARAMFASRACRKSVMIGMPLTKIQMSTVVTHMGTMDQPWNCPHGRPTMRHLFDMANIRPSANNDRALRNIDWGAFA